jgi:hypothetical protein
MKKITYVLSILLLIFAGSFLNIQTAKAAGAEVEITTDSTEVTLGDSLNVYITIRSDKAFGDFEANLTYDDNILEYQGGNSFIAGSSGFLKISDTNVAEGDTVRKYSLQFKTLEIGTCEVALMEPFMVYDYETGTEMPVSSNVLTVNVKAPVTASTNAKLKSLKISPSVLTPAFDKNTFTYSTTVGYETQRLIIDAEREDSKAIVKITGNDSLKEGENKIIVTVIAESGDVIEYTINALRETAPATEGNTDNGSNVPGAKAGIIEAVQADGITYLDYQGRYKLVEPGPEVQIPNGYIKTKIIISQLSINVYAPEDNLGSEFLLVYAENEQGQAGFYRYDKTEKTLQRYTSDGITGTGNEDAAAPDSQAKEKEYRNNMMKAVLIITLLSVFCALLIVVIVRMYMKTGKQTRKHRK